MIKAGPEVTILDGTTDSDTGPTSAENARDGLETTQSLVEWIVTSLTNRDFDEPTPDTPTGIQRKITDEIVSRGEEAVQPLIDILNHADWAVRCIAATLLGRLKSTLAISPLMACIRTDPSVHVQASAANALHNLGDPTGLEIVRQWKFQAADNDEIAFRRRMNDFITFGLIDKALRCRLNELARRYSVEPEDIAISCLTYTASERERIRAGNAVAIFGGLMMTEDEYRSLQELGYIVR